MHLSEIRIKNFRSFKDETIHLDKYICLVGPNGSGKSTILLALNVFFRNTSSAPVDLHNLSDEDFHHKNTASPVEITLTFENLSEKAQEGFKAYYRSGKLVVSAIAKWDPLTETAVVKQYGSRLVMPAFKLYFEALENKAKVKELQSIYAKLKKKFSDLPTASTKGDMETSLRGYEESHPEKCKFLLSENQFYGWSKGDNRLTKHLQWIYVPCVKDASTEQDEGRNTALGQLLDRTIRSQVSFQEPIDELRKSVTESYNELIQKEQHVLDSLSSSLTTRIQEWTHSGTKIALQWHYNPDKSFTINDPLAKLAVGEHSFMGEIARLGHGLQRTVFVSLLQELAESDEQSESTLLLGFEEPELYQHPPQARHMASLLEKLSEKNSQVLLSTHSPYFVPSKGFENMRMIRKENNLASKISQATYEEITNKIADSLGEEPRPPTSMLATIAQIMQPSQNELYFANVVVLVEGIEDIAYLSTHLKLSEQWNEFRKYGCHFIVGAGKSSMSRPLAIAKTLDIPAFVVFDADSNANERKLENHSRDNKCLLSLCGINDAEPLPSETLWHEGVVMWHSNIEDVVSNDFGLDVWEAAETKARNDNGFMEGVRRKNTLLIAATLEELFNNDKQSDILDKACNKILEFAKKQ